MATVDDETTPPSRPPPPFPPPPPSRPFMTPSPPTMSTTGGRDGAPSPPRSRAYKSPSAPRPPYPEKRPSAMTLEDLEEMKAMPATPDFSPEFDKELKHLETAISGMYGEMERGPGGPGGTPPLDAAWEYRMESPKKPDHERECKAKEPGD